ncbi:hypothetical protein, partial [Nocardia sputi]|uniref:hypothetical protein n=1 Tax=Nocardia sputi TaxID=2943705 RepID=UPI0020C08505
ATRPDAGTGPSSVQDQNTRDMMNYQPPLRIPNGVNHEICARSSLQAEATVQFSGPIGYRHQALLSVVLWLSIERL